MKTALIIYIAMGVLTVVPLLLYNIRKIWVKVPPDPVAFKPVRCVVILAIAVFIVVFLINSYQATLRNRYEIAVERVAQMHAEVLTSKWDEQEFWDFLEENGTPEMADDLKRTDLFTPGRADTVQFQLSSACRPQFWKDNEGFEQAEVVNNDNPLYLMYCLKANGDESYYYALRVVQTDDGWKYDWFGEASEQQQNVIEMPSELNGKWYTVE